MKVVLVCLLVIVAVYGVARVIGRLPANCDDVAEELASFELGNYAEPEDRAPVVDRYRAVCKREGVTRDEGACLAKAKSKLAAARCAPRLFPEVEMADCEGMACYLPKLEQFTAQMCACHAGDTSCATKVSEALARWSQDWAKLASELGTAEPTSERDRKAMTELMTRFSACITTAMTPTPRAPGAGALEAPAR